jgi:hypothetical protein
MTALVPVVACGAAWPGNRIRGVVGSTGSGGGDGTARKRTSIVFGWKVVAALVGSVGCPTPLPGEAGGANSGERQGPVDRALKSFAVAKSTAGWPFDGGTR